MWVLVRAVLPFLHGKVLPTCTSMTKDVDVLLFYAMRFISYVCKTWLSLFLCLSVFSTLRNILIFIVWLEMPGSGFLYLLCNNST